MTCHSIIQDGAVVGFACVRGRRSKPKACACGLTATKLCDGRVRGNAGRTRRCDRPVCDRHAKPVGPDLDHCPECAATAEARRAVTLPVVAGALVAYTDGSGTIATLPCGAGVAIFDGGEAILEASVHLGLGTNNFAELSAVRIALWMCGTRQTRSRPLEVRSDSLYTIDSLVAPYDPHPLASNAELITVIRRRIAVRGGVTFQHVHGHRGELGNERADELAGLARTRPSQRGA